MKLEMLDARGLKEIKHVELLTKFLKYVPEEWQDETCPPPDDAILAKFKIEKSEKMRSHFEKRKEQQQQRLESIAKRAAASALAVFRSERNEWQPQALALSNYIPVNPHGNPRENPHVNSHVEL
jgi:cyclopropane fatty-acyl-phospholipid synthase-like methyltransferase